MLDKPTVITRIIYVAKPTVVTRTTCYGCHQYVAQPTVVTLTTCYGCHQSCRTDPYLKAIGKNCAAADPRFVPVMPAYLDKNGHGKLGPMSQVWFPSEQWPSGTGEEWNGVDNIPHGPNFDGHNGGWGSPYFKP